MSDNPYTSLPSDAFWRTAVAELEPLQIDLRWRPKSRIDRSTGIITVGSCFAQHIGKALKDNGFGWIDSEPAPAALPATDHAQHNYGVFSFRTGNVYTAALLCQWGSWAVDPDKQSSECWNDDGRCFDPFRPSLNVEGFASPDEMLAARGVTLRAIVDSVRAADLFVFTLGLTEAWRNTDGRVYPMCPGTVRGTFSPEAHRFHNYDESEVRRDLAATFDALLALNPRLRFLITVSPVPLTATASGQHVLAATTYSKSVLRSAAGQLAQSRADTDYFPSYELIASSPFKAMFYEPNLRSVSPAGVAFVMRQFFGAVDDDARVAASTFASGCAVQPRASTTAAVVVAKDLCDEIILETWSHRTFDEPASLPNVLLLGDSHVGKLAAALDTQGVQYAGGAVMDSSDWFEARFDLRSDRFVFDASVPEAQARWNEVCTGYLAKLDLAAARTTFCITNVGSNTITPSVSGLMAEYLKAIYGNVVNRIDVNVVWAYVQRFRVKQLMLVRKLVDLGLQVVWVTDPPLQTKNSGLHRLIDDVLEELFAQTGCHVMNARKWLAETGESPSTFQRPEMDIGIDPNFADHHHGSDEYYRRLGEEIFRRYAIEPRSFRR